MGTNIDFYSFMNTINNSSSHEKIMYINIFVDSEDEELKKLYVEAAQKHNSKIAEDPHFYDAGFDLYLPKSSEIYGNETRFFKGSMNDKSLNDVVPIIIPINKVDFKVKCCAKMFNVVDNKSYFTPFYTYARSSMSKTPLRLANNQGIIDAGYRGNLIGMFDCVYDDGNRFNRDYDWYVNEYTRILQICAPGLVPIYVNIVNSIEALGPSTSRGEGGFGSTGK